MGLFFEMLSAINNPAQQGSVDQLRTVMNSAQQLGGGRIDPSTLQTVLSTVGGLIRPALQQQRLGGENPLGNLVGQVAGAGAGSGALQSLLNPQLQEQLVQGIAQKTGLDASTLQTMLPGILSAVTGFLNLGAGTPGGQGTNPVLNTFLDSDKDGDVDLGDVFKFASRFLNPSN
jgi:hypothetical protein